MIEFDALARERIGYYVYALFDPDDPSLPFYIGKGTGNRVFSHAAGQIMPAESVDDCLSPKAELIHQIKQRGKSVLQKIIRFGLSEQEAFQIEASLIDLVNHIRPETLKNQVSGHGSDGIQDATDLAIELAAVPLVTALPAMIIKIERRWRTLESKHDSANSIPSNEIYDATRGDWRLDVRRAMTAECVLAVAKGLVRDCFVAERWEDSGKEGRKRFDGRQSPEHVRLFGGQSVSDYFKRGGQNPIRYINC